MRKESALFQKYTQQIHPQRVRFLKSLGINYFMTESNQRNLHAFLLVWTGFSIKMTEKVESWIRRAGESCEKLNLEVVGKKLRHHASQEADHDQLLVNDLASLLQKWNQLYSDNLKADDVFRLSLPAHTDQYVALHENTISGAHPYTQIAIEFEIERISVGYGPRMIENLLSVLGHDFESGISFLADHVLLDQGHTKFNMDLLENCLAGEASLSALVETGGEALRIYAGFLDECVQLTPNLSKREPWKSALTI